MTVQEAIKEAMSLKEPVNDPLQLEFQKALVNQGVNYGDDLIAALACQSAAMGFHAGQIFEQNQKRMVEG
jgi:hypothetical protein